jgi:DNA-binding SARP family transcriptional activator
MLRIRLVGELGLELDGRRLDPPPSGRARSLLAWLAAHPGLHPRARVAAVFWPDVLDASARASLRTTLALLRRSLGEEAAGRIVAGRERIGIEDGADVWIDVREIDRLAAAGRWEEALALCGDDLLTDLDDDWVLEARGAHRERVGELLARLGEAAEERGDQDAAVRLARRRLELDPLSEDAARALIRRLALAGDRGAAIAAYEAFRAALRRELGIVPSAETRALAGELRDERPAMPAEAPLPLPDALSLGGRGPLVGRAEPLDALRAAWDRARAGTATVVALSGEAGSGKTRLLIDLAERARAAGATVLAGRCAEDGVVPFAPFTEALRPYVARDPGLPAWATAELGRLLPELDPAAERAAAEAPDARHRLFEAVALAVGHAARGGPVLLVVEDLHWADAATLLLLGHIVRTVGWARVLVACSIREEGEAAPGLLALLGDLHRERTLVRVALGGLSAPETADLAAGWLGLPPPPALAEAVHRRTGGNPLFVEELVRHLAESAAGRPVEALVDAAGREVPHGVRAVIDRRLARLGEPVVEAVRVAAVAGDDFALVDVAAAAGASHEALAERLDVAVRAGLLDESGAAGRYRFAHALIREAVLAGMTATRRALLHRRMGEVLEGLPAPARERRLPELARHLLGAGALVDPSVAAETALAAALAALRGLAYEDAADLLERALAGDPDERGRVELLLALGDARRRSGAGEAADEAFRRAAEAARALGDGDLLGRAALGRAGLAVSVGAVRREVRSLLEEALAAAPGDSALRPGLLARLAIEVYYERPVDLRERLSAEALSAGRRAGGPALREALGARHVALWSPAHTEERLAIADELIAASRGAGDPEAELQGINWRVADLFELGDRDALVEAIVAHERLAGELRLPSFAWYAPMWRATLAHLAGRIDEALRLSAEGARIGRLANDDNAELLFGVQQRTIRMSTGDAPNAADEAEIRRRVERSPARCAWQAARTLLAAVSGDLGQARLELAEGVAQLAAAPLDANWLYAAHTLGAVAARLGDVAAAGDVYARLAPYGGRVVTVGRGCFCAGSASLALGLLAATLGDRRASAAHLEEAVRRNEALGAVPFASAARDALAHLRAGVAPAEAALPIERLRGASGGLTLA